VESNGDEEAARLLDRYRAMVRSVVARHAGAEVRTEGDSFYVLFPTASRAVAAALGIVEEAARRLEADPAYPIRVGVGVHAGEAVETPEGPVGSAVNLAARLCSIAAPGEVLVSDTVRGLLRTRGSLGFEAAGVRRLKGIEEPVTVFRVRARDGGGASPSSTVRPPTGNVDRSPRPLRSRRSVLALLGSAALVGVVAVAAVMGRPSSPGLVADRTATPPPATLLASTHGPTPAPTSAPKPSFPTVAERSLLERLPSDLTATCSRSDPTDGGQGGGVALRCEPPMGAAADRVWFDEFEPEDGARTAFFRLVAGAAVPPGDCDTDTNAHDHWTVAADLGGERACYRRDGTSWVLWTNPATGLLGRAMRADGDVAALLGWWDETAPFIR
jgi:hypothetical protein